MKITTTVILAMLPLLQAQDAPDPGKHEVRILMNQAGPLASSTVQFVSSELVGGVSLVKASPYSSVAVTETTQTLADGSHIVHKSSSKIYRDSDGRERREMSFPMLGASQTGSQSPQTVMIVDPVAGFHYVLDTKSHTAHKMPMPPLRTQNTPVIRGSAVRIEGGITVAAGMIPPPAIQPDVFFTSTTVGNGTPPEPPKVEQLGTMTLEGIQAEGTRTTVTIPVGQIGNDKALDVVSERWFSPELKVPVLTRHSDPRMGETVYRLTEISRSEPIRSLFEIPADFTITDDAGPIKAPNGTVSRLP